MNLKWLKLISVLLLATSGVLGQDKFLSNPRQLIFEGRRSGEGYFSPDGKALIFQAEREPGNPFFQIYLLDLETGDSHRVSPGVGKTTCAFFQPGTDRVLFASTHLDLNAKAKQEQELAFRAQGKTRRYDWDYDEYMDIFTARRDGSDLKRLTTTRGYDAEGSYSPDGKKIVFASLRNAYPPEKLSEKERKLLEVDPAYFAEIYIMDADGSNQTRLTDWPGYDGGPFFSPDGQRIVWRHFEENGAVADIYTMRPDGSDVRRLTDFQAMSWAPYYHPSGEYLIFTSNKLGFENFELFIVDREGEHEPVRVTYTPGFDGLGVFSPDGKRLAWTSSRTSNGKAQIFLAEWDHEAALAALQAAPARSADHASKNGHMGSALGTGALSATDKKTLSPEIRSADLESLVGYLASDELAGRMTGTEGTKKAAEYIVKRLQEAGLQPFGDNGTYFQEFEFTAGIKLKPDANQMTLRAGEETSELVLGEEFRPLGFTDNGHVEGDVVFAGYGLSVPGPMGEGYDSYEGLDVKDKVVLVLRYVPEEVSMERRQVLNRYAGLRYKAMIAREHGARALLVVTGPNSPKAGELVPLSFDRGLASSGIVAASISGQVAEKMFQAAGKDLQKVQSELDRENPHFEGHFALGNVRVTLTAEVERIKKTDHNVVARLAATAADKLDEYVVLGAHYDHIGYGEIGSLARKGEEGQIHNGADDNASGTATVLELAAYLAQAQKERPELFKRGVIVALWSGEELGIIGSNHFVEHPPVAKEKMVAYLNFDMVGRLRDNKLILQGVGSSSLWPRLIEKRNVAAGFNLVLQEDPYQPTDISAFYPKGVPVLSFFTGSHEDYNRPTDDPETLDYAAMERIAKFAQNIVKDLVSRPERPDYQEVQRAQEASGGRETLRAYLGTIPDYVGGDFEGVKLSGVRAGGPADKAGLKGGDVIIEFGGQKITNIYDYTYALDAIKIGEPVEVVVLRDGKKVKITVVPEARR